MLYLFHIILDKGYLVRGPANPLYPPAISNQHRIGPPKYCCA